MTKLNLNVSCEIDNLLDVMSEEMNLSYSEVEKMAFKESIYPTSSNTFMTTKFGMSERDGSLKLAILTYMLKEGIERMYITNTI